MNALDKFVTSKIGYLKVCFDELEWMTRSIIERKDFCGLKETME